MSMPHIRYEVAMMLAEVGCELAEAEHRLATGAARDRVAAAGAFVLLKRQKALIEARLAEIDAHPAATETFLAWFKEELFNFKVRLEGGFGHP
ncbi:MAG TPA: hypothetical protein VGS12_00210 [Caulobacteraceae bacterium]|nr:hypothetical protein [Caulobacteraceae bacterium]